MGNKARLIIGILLMAAGIGGATLEISTRWHYFGNGALFGIGLVLLIGSVRSLISGSTSKGN